MIVPGTKPEYFRMHETARKLLLDAPVRWGHGALSEMVFRRTYSRDKPDGTTESWNECVVRVTEGTFTVLKTHALRNHIPWDEARAHRLSAEFAQRMQQFKWTPPGRGLRAMGTDMVFERGAMCLQNCAFVSTSRFGESVEETVEPFGFLMDCAMLGVGPGFDTRGAGKVGVKGNDGANVVFRVPDTREGWVEAVKLAIRNSIFGGGYVIPDVQDVRGPGLPLKTFGGISSGPVPLVQGIHGIQAVLGKLRGQDITSTVITDVNNLIGKIVVSGNIRRTAEISFSVPGDVSFRDMKNYQVHEEETGNAPPSELRDECEADYRLYHQHQFTTHDGVTARLQKKYEDRPWAYKFGGWRWASNNSIFEEVGADYGQYDKPIENSGEPGFAWLEMMRKYGRLKDPPDHADYRAEGGNPCLEQTLESYECCTLVENYPSHCDNYWDFQRTLKFSYLYAKTVTLMGTHVARTNAVMSRNRRIGCSMSGVVDAITKVGRTEFFTKWCDQGYGYINYIDRKYSDWLGVRPSIKKTSQKPSGTVSLVSGMFGSGAHWPEQTGYRTIRVAADGNMERALRRAGYRVEPSVTDPSNTSVIYFPWLVPDGVKTNEVISVWEQFKMAADLQYWWSDNQVSFTAKFSQEEADRGEISRVLTAFDGQLKGISLNKKNTTAYKQMPFTPADREEVLAYISTLKQVNWDDVGQVHDTDDKFCEGGACQVAG